MLSSVSDELNIVLVVNTYRISWLRVANFGSQMRHTVCTIHMLVPRKTVNETHARENLSVYECVHKINRDRHIQYAVIKDFIYYILKHIFNGQTYFVANLAFKSSLEYCPSVRQFPWKIIYLNE